MSPAALTCWSNRKADEPDPSILLIRVPHRFGPNAWLTGFYPGALKAAAEMAPALGEPQTAAEYRALFERGRAWADAHLFNGRYYCCAAITTPAASTA